MEECGEGKGMRGREDIIVYWTWVPIGNWTNPLRAEELFHLTGIPVKWNNSSALNGLVQLPIGTQVQ